jgi:hypothetical protein
MRMRIRKTSSIFGLSGAKLEQMEQAITAFQADLTFYIPSSSAAISLGEGNCPRKAFGKVFVIS